MATVVEELSAGQSAVLYVVTHEEMDALKVGITSTASKSDRVRAHTRRGWSVSMVLPFAAVEQARRAEKALIGFLRSCGATETVRSEQMPQGGYTETVAFARGAGVTVGQLANVAKVASDIVTATSGGLYRIDCWTREVRELLVEITQHSVTYSQEERKKMRALLIELRDQVEEWLVALDDPPA
ncbi:hypothetical protein ABZ419_29830 [Streptomyces cinnamoneus]|uniref:hypothetical protein n=1 Tax=Streptomyces cinnamoneus TaxID=53446 RepID=UPI0033D48F90